MKIAIMQPYFFPYLGYFQLINSVDIFVFYDDVNFIKGGWINRNLLYRNNKNGYFTLRLNKSSSNKKINNIEILDNRESLRKTLTQTYKKAPYFETVMTIFEKSIYSPNNRISEINIESITLIANYLDLPVLFYKSSEYCPQTIGQTKESRIITICSELKADKYINMINGNTLYNKENFKKEGIDLLFLEPVLVPYKQFDQEFKSGLSIIDALMFNSPREIQKLISSYRISGDA
jgi:hypothetical protein